MSAQIIRMRDYQPVPGPATRRAESATIVILPTVMIERAAPGRRPRKTTMADKLRDEMLRQLRIELEGKPR